jgi:crotonobetainyl-CoA:carnitine CoA-transferase CaiB-like acyl-CoA transferase
MTERKGSRRLAALHDVVVLERSHTPAAAHAGQLLHRLGAEVWIEDRSLRSCNGCDLPADALAAFDVGKRVLDVIREGELRARHFDIGISDEECCTCEVSSQGPDLPVDVVSARIYADDIRNNQRGAAAVSSLGAAALAGVAYAIGDRVGAPLGLPPGVAEAVAGTSAAAAILAVWYAKQNTVRPSRIDISMSSCLEFFVGMNFKMYEGYPREWRREGRRAAGSAGPYPAAIFQCRDGYVGLIGRSDEDWHGLIASMGNPSWADSPEVRDSLYVAENLADEIDVHVAAWAISLTEKELVELSLVHGFVVAPIRKISEVLAEPQHDVREFWTVDSSGLKTPGLPFRVAGRPGQHLTTASTGHQPRISKDHAGRRRLAVEPSTLLKNLRVLDLSWVWAGPMVGMVLADLGAEVIKVEHPKRPDGSRLRGRPRRPDGSFVEGPALEVTPYFHQVNHGKLSFGADLTDPEAAEIVRMLAGECDVVIENMRPGVLPRRGLGYEALAADNPGLIMLSMSLAGQDGPLAKMKGYAPVMGGLSGIDGLMGYSPSNVTGMYTFSMADPNAGVYGLLGLLAALIDRERTGQGCWLDLSQIESMISNLTLQVSSAARGREVLPHNNEDSRYVYQEILRCAGDDDWIAVTAPTDQDVARLIKLICSKQALSVGQHDLGSERKSLSGAVEEWALQHQKDEACRLLTEARIMAAPVLSWPEVTARRTTFGPSQSVSIWHPFGGEDIVQLPPWRHAGLTPGSLRRAPLLGEHTREICRGLLCVPDVTIEALLSRGALTDSSRWI